MCHQASFHLKIARKYPLLALKLPKNWVVFKTISVKRKWEIRRGIIPDTNYTNVDRVLQHITDFQALEDVYSVRQTSMRAITYCLWIVDTFSIHPFKLFFCISNTDALSLKLVHICSCCKLDQQATATFGFKKDGGQTKQELYCSEISKREGTNLIISP